MGDKMQIAQEIRILTERRDEVQGALTDAVYTLADIVEQIAEAESALIGAQRRVATEKALGDEYEASRATKATELSEVHDLLVAEKGLYQPA